MIVRPKTLFTGDTGYPGVLVVSDWSAFRTSVASLANFAELHPVRQLLGAHVEMKRTPRQFFAPRTPFQPDEHALPLGPNVLEKLRETVASMGPNPHSPSVQDEFVIEPI